MRYETESIRNFMTMFCELLGLFIVASEKHNIPPYRES
jgi:hypothetical protein